MDDAAQPSVRVGPKPGRQWVSVGRGLHRTGEPHDLLADLHAWSQVLRPMAAFTGLTVAVLGGWWLPPLPASLPVFAAMLSAQNHSRRPGLRITRHRWIPPSEVVGGVRVTTVPETVVACAQHLRLLDLVVLVDCVLHHGLATLPELEAVAREHRRGAPLLRRALALADARSESPWETILRLLHVVLGIAVEPQHELYDDGVLVARGDLLLVGTRMFHEYDGEVHGDRAQRRHDLKRSRRLGRLGYERRGFVSEDVLTQPGTILRDADETLGREHDPSRLHQWYPLVRESLWTPAGRAAFAARLRLPS